MKQDGEIRPTKEGYEATFTRDLQHPPARVWAMLTEPQRIALWYVRTEVEPRVGGRVIEHHDHAGEHAVSHGTVTRFEPTTVFEHTWWDDEYADAGIANVIRWELSPTPKGTRLVLTHRFPELDGAGVMMAGWHSFLDVMGEVLDGVDPSEHAPARGELKGGTFVETTPGRGVWRDRRDLEARYRDRIGAMDSGAVITGTTGMTVHVHDLERAAAFWRGLGLRGEASGGVVRFALPGSGPLVLHTWESACAHNGGRPPGTVSGLQLQVQDAADACARVTRAGGKVVAAPFPAPGGGTWAVVADPDGNEFMLCA